MMAATTGGNFNLANMALFMSQRYNQSKADNPNFYFGPKAVLLYGAASFLFELFPSLGIQGDPNLAIEKSFFGAESIGDGKFVFNNAEQIPDEWFNRRVAMNIPDVVADFMQMYTMHPALLGGNVGKNNFDALGSFSPGVVNGKFSTNPNDIICLMYQLATEDVPDAINNVETLPQLVIDFAAKQLNTLPVFQNAGCPLVV